MTNAFDALPNDNRVFDGEREERFLAVTLETVVQDMSPVGDEDLARQLGDYTLGEAPPPEDAPEYVELRDEHLTLSNPPFLMAELTPVESDEYTLRIEFKSDLQLLIDPPVCVTLDGSFLEVVTALEQLIAEIYRTKGRRLEMIDAGTIDTTAFFERR
ncbi:hypothetical protein RBH26_16955 [Natronolimnohabitans sp. A-GB9]|uniref:hypothetical protein n=1 Tax=Natronolimnohabitans sp. A-GB9 TaxID=3069757 RepID=UPI0027B80C8D|nr:hypothetical protein [Natronolimnohabitans sp. A-GB9]MDQ2052170.1 hypothetical protein [Natronolimnohabitans sp. A-GB9]